MGKITAVGMGPGGFDEMTPKARRAIEEADTVVGYKTYINIIAPMLAGKKVIDTGMTREIDRCRLAVAAAENGKNVAVISSGDAGVYGMAGLLLEILLQTDKSIRPEFSVAAGVSSVNAAAAILGAPLMHDFAVISLSDLLTSWETIEKRIDAAAAADFVIALYNPKSKKRPDNINKAQQIILRHRAPETPVGIVTAASRNDETKTITTLDAFTNEAITMFSTVIVGNGKTFVKDGFMITPRGYENKGGAL